MAKAIPHIGIGGNMNKHMLPTSTIINDVECFFVSDYRDILDIFSVFNEPNLLEGEKIEIALSLFYKTDDYESDKQTAAAEMINFINCCEPESTKDNAPVLYDWEQDFNIIVAPVNKIIGSDVRGLEYLHWWSFLSAFMEIGECTFSTYVSIRDKKLRNKKLETHEEKIYKDNIDRITLKPRYDDTTKALMDEILGRSV